MINYLILNEIIFSAIVYDQDANRSRRFTLAELGASLNFVTGFIDKDRSKYKTLQY